MSENIITRLGASGVNSVTTLGRSGLFIATAIFYVFRPPYRFSRILAEIEFIGAKSFLIVFVSVYSFSPIIRRS